MTESEWLACTDPRQMLEFLQGKGSNRQFQLFSCACCREVWHILTPEVAREVVLISERFADGCAIEYEEVAAKKKQATDYFHINYMHRNGRAYSAAAYCGWIGVPHFAAMKVYESLRDSISPTEVPLPDDFFCHVLRGTCLP
jgi:hypothetical protein